MISLFIFWLISLLSLWLLKKELFISTWNEPYFADVPVLIESDDWGVGGDFHADRLINLLNHLKAHKDTVNRSAVLTANIVLSVPDLNKINQTSGKYHRNFLHENFPVIFDALKQGIKNGNLVPQLHGLEHLNGNAFANLWQQSDPRMPLLNDYTNWWNWESLDSPLQGHYVDGSSLPTMAIDKQEAEELIDTATKVFLQIFDYPSTTTVAPCYLWDDNIEEIWKKHQISSIQTAGYRCTGRDETGKYIQSPSIIRIGEKNQYGQSYLVRNVMFEPVDGKHTAQSAFSEAKAAYRQALPISISTHRYNFTRTELEFNNSLKGLDQLLILIRSHLPNTRFTSSPELSDFLNTNQKIVINHFNQTEWPELTPITDYRKISYFLYRLYYRHPKLVLFSYFTGIFIPASILIRICRLIKYHNN